MTSTGPGSTNEATLEVAQLLEGLRPGEGDLLEALHRVQHRYGYLPEVAVPAVAQQLRLPESRVYGAVTFYSEFRQKPPPRTLVSWCSGPACLIKGAHNIRQVLEAEFGCRVGENSPGNETGLHLGQCNGTCDFAPQVWVNGKVVGPLDPATAIELARGLKEKKRA